MPAFGKFCTLRPMKSRNSQAGLPSCSSMRGPTAAKLVVGWRFAPACCAAQPVKRARRRSTLLRSTLSPFFQAVEALRQKRIRRSQQLSVQPTRPNQRAVALLTPKKSTCSWPALRVQWFMRAIWALSLSSESSPGESHPQALAEPYVRLSPHTAPSVQSPRPLNDLALIQGSSSEKLAQMDSSGTTSAPSVQSHYRTFIPTTSASAPVPRIGTLALVVSST